MNIEFEYTPPRSDEDEYRKILKKLFPTMPLYIFLAISAVLLIVMLLQHVYNPATMSLVFISISALCIMFGGLILRSTKSSLPFAEKEIMATLGKKRSFVFNDTDFLVTSEDEETIEYSRVKLIGQYCTDRHYIFCIANRPAMIPMVVGITPENIDALNSIVQSNNSRGVKLRKLKLR